MQYIRIPPSLLLVPRDPVGLRTYSRTRIVSHYSASTQWSEHCRERQKQSTKIHLPAQHATQGLSINGCGVLALASEIRGPAAANARSGLVNALDLKDVSLAFLSTHFDLQRMLES